MIKKIRQTIGSTLFQGSFLVLSANIIANFFNYLYHLITGRLLAPDQYGLLQSFIALSALLGILTYLFSYPVVNLAVKTNSKSISSLVKVLEKQSLKFSLILWLVLIASYPLIKSFLHIDNFFLFLIFSLQSFIYFLPIIYQSVLRAKLHFLYFSLLGIIATLTKFIAAPFFIFIGWGLGGALGAFVVSGLSIIFAGQYWVRKFWPGKIKEKRYKLKSSFWQFSLLSLITNFFLISLFSSDILLVRYFLDPYLSGIYAAVSVLGKMIFFGASSVLIVVYPLLVKFKKNPRKLMKIFGLTFFALLFMTIIGMIVFKFSPHIIVNVLYGSKYKAAVYYLPIFSLFVSLLVILNLFIQFFLALEYKMAGWLAGLAAILQIFLIIIRHENIKAIIENSIISIAVVLALSFIMIIKYFNGWYYEKKRG